MRQRLTASFVVLSVVLLLLALGIRSITTHDLLRTHESRELRRESAHVALLVQQREELGQPVDQEWLSGLVDAERAGRVRRRGRVERGRRGRGVRRGRRRRRDLGHHHPRRRGGLTLRQSGSVIDELAADNRSSLGFLLLLVVLLAAMVGYVMARLLSRPFRQLAGAAGQLGRGRFDLDLPRTRIPEARAISQALLTSAGQLQERLASEQAFAEHASHVLRTPLTGLRLELEELAQRDDVPADVHETANRAVGRIEAMDALAGDLVSLTRQRALVAGAEIPIRDLATQCAQTWADALGEQDRSLTAAVEGDLETTYTPGPVEHILDLLLADVLKRGQGSVRMVFEADEDGPPQDRAQLRRRAARHRRPARRPPDHPGPRRGHRARRAADRRGPAPRVDPPAAALNAPGASTGTLISSLAHQFIHRSGRTPSAVGQGSVYGPRTDRTHLGRGPRWR